MKKGKKSLSLVLATLCVVSLSACNEITAGEKGVILDYDYNGKDFSISTNDIIEKYLNENRNDHAKALYDALYEIVVRSSFESKKGEMTEDGKLADYAPAIKKSVDDEINKQKDSADQAGTDWYTYLSDTLGYNDDTMSNEEKEKEFFLDTQFKKMTEKVDEQFLEVFDDWNKKNPEIMNDELQKKYNLLWGENGFIENYVPYHVKHILVQVDAAEDYGYSRGHVSSDNVHKLYQTVTNLVEGDSFSNVAKKFSDDGGSAQNGGEYIMLNDTSFVNEFKLGVYTNDLLLNNQKTAYESEAGYQAKKDNLHIPEKVEENLIDFGATFIPYGVIAEMENVKDVTKTEKGQTVYNGDADYFPRNIYFNKYFQNRNVAFITNETAWTEAQLIGSGTAVDPNASVAGYDDTRIDPVDSSKKVFSDIDNNGHYATSGEKVPGLKTDNFKKLAFSINGKAVEKDVLCDTDGNPIMVVRNKESSAGIHFIVVERSAFDTNDINFKANPTAGTTEQYKTTLEEYYAPVSPKEIDGINQETKKPFYVEEFPNVKEQINGKDVFIPKKTYVQTETIGKNSTVDNTVESYTKRANDIKDNIKKSINSFNKYKWLNSNLDIKLNKINGNDVQALVDRYVEKELRVVENSNAQSLENSWVSYWDSIEKQTSERKYVLLPEILATNFGEEDLYKKDAPGYNAKYDDIKPGQKA